MALQSMQVLARPGGYRIPVIHLGAFRRWAPVGRGRNRQPVPANRDAGLPAYGNGLLLGCADSAAARRVMAESLPSDSGRTQTARRPSTSPISTLRDDCVESFRVMPADRVVDEYLCVLVAPTGVQAAPEMASSLPGRPTSRAIPSPVTSAG